MCHNLNYIYSYPLRCPPISHFFLSFATHFSFSSTFSPLRLHPSHALLSYILYNSQLTPCHFSLSLFPRPRCFPLNTHTTRIHHDNPPIYFYPSYNVKHIYTSTHLYNYFFYHTQSHAHTHVLTISAYYPCCCSCGSISSSFSVSVSPLPLPSSSINLLFTPFSPSKDPIYYETSFPIYSLIRFFFLTIFSFCVVSSLSRPSLGLVCDLSLLSLSSYLFVI